MSYTPHYIASYDDQSGMYTYSEPFLAPEKAFPFIEDMYCWRGRLKRRQGVELIGRLRRVFTPALPVTLALQANGGFYTNMDIFADAALNLRAPAGVIPETYAEIEPGTLAITVGAVTFVDNGDGTLTGAPAGNFGTINYVTGRLDLVFVPPLGILTNVVISFSYFPSLPVMGLLTREQPAINDEQLVAFDRKYAYTLIGGVFVELPSAAATTWLGSDSDLFWGTSYWKSAAGNDIFFATNANKGATPDPIRYYDSTTWTTFNPLIDAAANRLQQCRCLLPYKGRLVAFNTWEGANLAAATNFPNRIRWSQKGSPIDLVNGWLETTVGRGGVLDAPVNEEIISVEFVRDVLLVKFERSSWKLIYTGNEALPFVFQKINTELGAESTFSLVPFDDGVYAVGNYGITTDDSVSVERIDKVIPQTVFSFNNDNDGTRRVYGIRDYANELVYWAYPNSAENPTFPNRVLVYNYANDTWAVFNDSFTCFGYCHIDSDKPWSAYTSETWAEFNEMWNSGASQSLYPDICAGNQQGFVERLNKGVFNDVSLSITAVNVGVVPNRITVIDHNLQTDAFIKITGCTGTCGPALNNVIYRVRRFDKDTLQLYLYDATTGLFNSVDIGAGLLYFGGGEVTVVNNVNVSTKVFAPFYDQGSQCRLGYIDFLLDITQAGELTANVYTDENDTIPINDPFFPTVATTVNFGLMGNNVLLTRRENPTLLPFQGNQAKIWHRVFVQAIVQNFQIKFTMNPAQMSSEAIGSSDIVIHAMVLYLSKNSRLTS